MDLTFQCQLIQSGSRPGRPIAWSAYKTGIVLTALIIAACMLFLPVFRRFAVIDAKTGRILYLAAVVPGEVFSIKYVHSVNKSPVEDVFIIQPDYRIMLTKTIFMSFGAGVPAEPEAGQALTQMEDRIEIDGIDRLIDPYLLRVGTIANHTLCIQGNEIPLDRLVEPMQAVRMEVRRVCAFILLKRGWHT